MRNSLRAACGAATLAAAALLASCTAGPEVSPSPSASLTEVDIGELGAPGCSPASPSLGLEVQATGSDGVTAYGLMFGPEADSITGDGSSIKMAVRMTGDGELEVHVIAPDGTERPLDWGPEAHGGSNFQRPGEEWGIGFSPDAPGCWQVAFERGERDRADFWFEVGD